MNTPGKYHLLICTTNSLPDFETGARYIAADGKKPTYSALYEITDYGLFSHEKYTQLRANRSPREAALVKRLETLDRRACKTVSDTGRVNTGASDTAGAITTLFVNPVPSNHTITEQSFETFFEKYYLPAMRSSKGWRRTARHQVLDSLETSVGKQPRTNSAEKWLIVNGMHSLAHHTIYIRRIDDLHLRAHSTSCRMGLRKRR